MSKGETLRAWFPYAVQLRPGSRLTEQDAGELARAMEWRVERPHAKPAGIAVVVTYMTQIGWQTTTLGLSPALAAKIATPDN
jgi:hypothetical protein